MNKNNFDFYDDKGKSIRKALMKTPINGARLSSFFEIGNILYWVLPNIIMVQILLLQLELP